MLICGSCKENKSADDFYDKNSKRKHSYCKICFNRYCIDRWIQKKLDAIKYKGGQCKNCGYSKFYGALEFHHREPNKKEFVWNKLRLKSWENITIELDKCDLLCSNCHKEIHHIPSGIAPGF
mgnify:CR=1 FL=1